MIHVFSVQSNPTEHLITYDVSHKKIVAYSIFFKYSLLVILKKFNCLELHIC